MDLKEEFSVGLNLAVQNWESHYFKIKMQNKLLDLMTATR